jgi:hypothetical protein
MSPGDVLVLAAADASNALTHSLVAVYPDLPSLTAIPPSDATYAWVIAGKDIIQADGEPLEDAQLLGLKLISAPNAPGAPAALPAAMPGSCGRCLAPTSVPPQTIYPGDDCPIPSFATAVGGASAPAMLKATLRLEWPGACPCLPFTANSDAATLDAKPVKGVVEPALGFDGTSTAAFVIFDRNNQLTRLSTGAVWGPAQPTVLATGEGLHAVRALPDGSYYVVVSKDNEDRIAQVDARFTMELASSDTSQVYLNSIIPLPNSGGLFLVLGVEPVRSGPEALLCQQAMGVIQCSSIASDEFRAAIQSSAISALLTLPGHLMFMAGNGRGVSLFEGPVPPDHTAPSGQVESDTFASGTYGMSAQRWAASTLPDSDTMRIHGAGAIGSQVFLCTQDYKSHAPSVVVRTASVTHAALTSGMTQPDWKVVSCVKNSRCAGFSHPDATRLRLTLEGGAVLDFGPDGMPIGTSAGASCQDPPAPSGDAYPGLDRPLRYRLPFGPAKGALVETEDGSLFLRTTSTSTSFRRLYGPAIPGTSYVGAVVETADRIFALGSAGTGAVADLRATMSTTVATIQIGGASPDDVVLGAVLDSAAGELVLFGETRSGGDAGSSARSFLRRVSPATLAARSVDLPADVRLSGIAERIPGEQVLSAAQGRLFRLRGETLTEIAIDWEDPFAPGNTGAPQLDDQCLPRRAGDPILADADDRFRAIDASYGVAWAVGCHRSMVRIDAAGARGVAPTRIEKDLGETSLTNATLTAVRAVCPDSVLLGVAQRHSFRKGPIDSEARLLTLLPTYGPGGMPTDATLQSGEVPEEHGNPITLGPGKAIGSGAPSLFVGSWDGIASVMYEPEAGLPSLQLGVPSLNSFGFQATDAVVSIGALTTGHSLIGTAHGRFYEAVRQR